MSSNHPLLRWSIIQPNPETTTTTITITTSNNRATEMTTSTTPTKPTMMPSPPVKEEDPFAFLAAFDPPILTFDSENVALDNNDNDDSRRDCDENNNIKCNDKSIIESDEKKPALLMATRATPTEINDCVIEIKDVSILEEHDYSKAKFCTTSLHIWDELMEENGSSLGDGGLIDAAVCDDWSYGIQGNQFSDSSKIINEDPLGGANDAASFNLSHGAASSGVVDTSLTSAFDAAAAGAPLTPYQITLDHDYAIPYQGIGHFCKVCSMAFTTRHQLTNHYDEHIHDKKTLHCPDCDAKFTDIVSFLIHQKKHETESHPRRRSSSRRSSSSISEDTPPEMQKVRTSPFSCLHCFKPFISFSKLIAHQEIHKAHGYKCPICFKTFDRMQELSDHGSEHKETLGEVEEIKPVESVAQDVNPVVKRRPCLTSTASAAPPSGKKYKCPYCDATFPDTKQLSTHHLTHAKERRHLVCSFCLASFKDQESFSKHRLWHIKDKSGFFHRSSRGFREHCEEEELIEEDEDEEKNGEVATPTGSESRNDDNNNVEGKTENPSDAVSEVEDWSSLLVKMESDDAPFFVATEDGKELEGNAVASASTPTAPVDPNRKYRCSDCDKAFMTLSTLGYHVRRCHAFVCPDCGKSFKWLNDLNDHRTVYVSKPLRISKCRKLAVISGKNGAKGSGK